MVEFETNVYIESVSVYSGSIGDNGFCAFIEEKKEGQDADKECQFYCRFYMGEGSVALFRVRGEGG